MRFIAVGVERGHAMDVPWDRWAHSEPRGADQERCRAQDLLFETGASGSEGLSGLFVRCAVCSASRDLGALTSRDSLRRIGFRCTGSQPWQSARSGGCDERVEVLQRGATNVTIAETSTALDIPEPTTQERDEAADVRQHKNFEDVRTAPTSPRAPMLVEMIAEDLGVSEELVWRLVKAGPDELDAVRAAREGLLADEWSAFQQALEHPDEPVGTPNFVVELTEFLPERVERQDRLADDLIRGVILAHRLREVRVLHGFRRYDVSADLVDVDLGPRGRTRWLPAVESFGEGVLLAVDESELAAWEQQEAVVTRVRDMERRRRASVIGSRLDEATPRLVMLHTLAHVLMRQLAFSSGYSAASLRERVYARHAPNSQAGVLIYTAAGDAEGTLGGLVRQGLAPRLLRSLYAALESSEWCSSDPLCRESHGQGPDALNRAACHGCALVSETSCERSNLLLDRVLLVGDGRVHGFFQDVVEAVRHEASNRAELLQEG